MTTGSEAGGGTEAVAARRIDHRDFDADIGRLPEGRWGLLFRRSARYCSVRFTHVARQLFSLFLSSVLSGRGAAGEGDAGR